jgi:hypothetical protein
MIETIAHREDRPRRLLETEIRQLDCCRAGEAGYLIGTDEPLCRPRKTNHEVYRFIWRSSFDGDAVVHITRKDQAIALRWKRTFTAAAPSVTLSLNGLPVRLTHRRAALASRWRSGEDARVGTRFA